MTELLNELNACQEAKQWAEGRTLSQAWQECQRANWMLWLLGRSPVNEKIIAAIAVEFAETCVHNAKNYPAVAQCIAVVKRFLAGEATQEELLAAESAARSAAWSAWSAARSAAWSAVRSAESAARSAAWSAAWSAARSAESAARSAAWSAVWSAARSAVWSARLAADSANCEIIRKHVSADEICKLFRKGGVK